MPRTLPAALTTAMDSGVFEPYIRVMLGITAEEDGQTTVQPLGFALRSMSATVKIAKFTDVPEEMNYFRIVRGAVINGTPSTISSVWFKTMEMTFDGKFIILTGFVLDDSYRTVAANGTFQDVLESVISQVDPTSPTFTYEGVAASAWKDLQFYRTDEVPKFTRASNLINVLKQKYLVFITENGWDGNNNDFFLFCAPYPRTQDYTFTDILFNGNAHTEDRRLLYTDDNGEMHDQGAVTLPIHNMGYLAAGSDFPYTTTLNSYVGAHSSKLPVHLKRRTGDDAATVGDGSGLNEFDGRIVVTEVFDPKSTPSWYQVISSLVWFSGNEGNIQPDLEIPMKWRPTPGSGPFDKGATTYEPVVTGQFTGILDESDNNFQAALEKIDRHTHTGLTTLETNAASLFQCNNPGGPSIFIATINGTPSGTSVVYNAPSAGTEGVIVPLSTAQLAKMRLYNTTRGNSALISNANTGTNTITLTATVPANWANGDTITIASQTVVGTFNWVDLEITSGPTGKTSLWLLTQIRSNVQGDALRLHPFETFAVSKAVPNAVMVASTTLLTSLPLPIPITSNVFSIAWNGTWTNAADLVNLKELGYT
jgi:hypothetical protein